MSGTDLTRLKPVQLTDWEDDKLSGFTNELFNKYVGCTKKVDIVSDSPEKYYTSDVKKDGSAIIHLLFKDSGKRELAAICVDCLPYKHHIGERKFYGQSNFDVQKWAQSVNLREGKRQIFVYDNEQNAYHGIITEYKGQLVLALNNKRGYEKGENNRAIEFFNSRIFDEAAIKKAPDFEESLRANIDDSDASLLSQGLMKLSTKDKTGLLDCGIAVANGSSEAKALVEKLVFVEDFYLAQTNIKMLAHLFNFGIRGERLVQFYNLCNNDIGLMRTVCLNVRHGVVKLEKMLEKIDNQEVFNKSEIIPDYFIVKHSIKDTLLWQSPVPAQLREDALRRKSCRQRVEIPSQRDLELGSQVTKALENNYIKVDIYLAKLILSKLKNFEDRAYKEGHAYTDSWLYGEGLVARLKRELSMGIDANTYEAGNSQTALKAGQKLEDCSNTILISRGLAVELMQDMHHILYVGSVLRDKLEKELMKGTKGDKKSIKKKDEGRTIN